MSFIGEFVVGVITGLTPEDCGCDFTGRHGEMFYVSRTEGGA